MKVLQDFDRPAYQRFYGVAGRLLFIESHNSRLAQLVGSLFDGWLLTPLQPTQQRPDVTVRFYHTEVLPEIPSGLDHFEIADGGRCYTDGESYYLALNSSLILVQQGPEVAVALWTTNLPAAPDAELARATSFAVCSGLRRWGLFDFHAAGVVCPANENGVLIVGRSGSGKSTLTLQLVKSGWRYLSDDELLLGVTGAEVEARGFRKFFAISETTAAACGANSLHPADAAETNPNLKICFDPSTLFPFTRTESIAPRWMLFTEITGGSESRFSELTQTEAMIRLIRACPWATYDRAIAGSNLNVLSLLARQARAFDLKAGSDLLESSRASDLLASCIGPN
jgi:hypothetical protein